MRPGESVNYGEGIDTLSIALFYVQGKGQQGHCHFVPPLT
jgi:hypothetical protein